MEAGSIEVQPEQATDVSAPAAKRQRFDSAEGSDVVASTVDVDGGWPGLSVAQATTAAGPVDVSIPSTAPALNPPQPTPAVTATEPSTGLTGGLQTAASIVSEVSVAQPFTTNPVGITSPGQQQLPPVWGVSGAEVGAPMGSIDIQGGGVNENLYFGPKSRWRKYGEKQPAGREGVLKTYFRCTHPGCPAKRTVTRQPGQAMEDGSVEMVAAHSHTEQEYLSALADGTPRQHQRFRGENEVDGEHGLPNGLDERGMPMEQDGSSMANVPVVAKAENVAVDGTTAVHHRPPTAGLPHTAAHIQAGMQAAGSLQEVVLVVKAFDHECVIYPLGREQIERVARTAGARVMKNLSKSVTHVLVTSAQMNDSVYQSAYAGYTMVDEEWLRAAVGVGSQLGAMDGGIIRAAQAPVSHVAHGMSAGAAVAGAQVAGAGAAGSEVIVAWCPICHKGFTTSQGMGGHYGRCKASFLAEQQQSTTTNAAGSSAVQSHPTLAAPSAPRPNVGFYVCPHGWLAADCAECKIGQDDANFQNINVTVAGQQTAAAGENQEDLASLFTDDFCVQLNNLVNASR